VTHPGLGVMLGMLSGNQETVDALRASLGKKITKVELLKNQEVGYDRADALRIEFEDQTVLLVWDGGQSCCESRYMITDAALDNFVGATLMDVEVVDGPSTIGEYDEVHEQQFLNIKTDKGILDCVTHNEHNGYYGGFWIQAKLEAKP
jgi:hypothetical protein